MLEVRLLGGLEARVDGRPVDLPADARARELLARLALAPAPQPRSALAGRIRPDAPEESARKTLRNAVYELRRALGPARDAVVVAADRLSLADDVRVDVRDFRRHLADGDLERAAALAAGDLLDGVDGDWAVRARERHVADLAGLFAALADRAAEAGDTAAAVAWARRGLEAEPLAESAHRRLIRVLALTGDRPAALAAARDLSARLRDELGVAPSAETRALVDGVRRGVVGRTPVPGPAGDAGPVLPPALGAAERPEGRAPVLRRLEEAWRGVLAGTLGLALVAGEPGIGKTTLAAELARRVDAGGGGVLLGRCDEHALIPFQPWVEALEHLLDALPQDEADGWVRAHDGALGRLLPSRGPGGDGAAGPRARYLAFETVRRLVADAAARRPLLLVLDDVHWAEPDSLALLRHLVRGAPRARVLVVMTARPAETGAGVREALADLRRVAPLVHVDLAGLDEEAVAALLRRWTGTSDPEAARRLRVRSGGNPLFLGELLREGGAGGGEGPPPEGVRDAITRRLGRLGHGAREVLEAAAVHGLEFDVGTVAAALDRPVVEVLAALDGALDAALVADRGAGRHAFTHALVAEAIAATLPASRRVGLHRALAGVLADGGAGAGEVVRHLRAAAPLVEPGELVRWELAAAAQAGAASAHDEAAAHLAAALGVPGGLRGRARVEAVLGLGRSRDHGGRRDAARRAFTEAAALAREGGHTDLLARAALGHGGTAMVIAAADPASVDLLEEALRATPRGDPATEARLLARLAVELYYADWDRARELGAQAVERAREAGDGATLAAALNARRVALWSPHHADERLAVAGEMLETALAAGDRELVLRARNWRVVDLLELGRVADAAAEVDAYAAVADAVGLPHFAWYVPMWRATLANLAGRWEEGRELSERALALGARADDPNAPLFVGIQRENALFARRRVESVDRERLVREAARTPASAEWLVNVALLDALRGDRDGARAMVADLARDGVASLRMDVNWHAACVLAEAAVEVGDRRAGAALHALLEPHARLFPLIARAVSCFGSAEMHVGRLAGLLGRPDEAVARLRRAVAADDRAGAGPRAAAALLHLGRALRDRGDHGEARDVLARAAADAERLGMPDAARDAREVLAASA